MRVLADQKLVKAAPAIDTDGALTVEAEPALFEHYGLAYPAGASDERRLGRR